jgi:SAM-dependent methyltransferase
MEADATAYAELRRLNWDLSARQYDAYASEKNLYRDSAAAMVQLAGIKPGMTVLDLACGTGIVTEAIVKASEGLDVKIIGVDFSPEMLALARKRVGSAGVEFHCRRAEELTEVVKSPVDLVLCNAAFWHFERELAAAEISRILKPTGRLLIGLPPQNFKRIDLSSLYEKDKKLWMVMEELSFRGHRLRRGEKNPAKHKRAALDKNEVEAFFSRYHLIMKEVHTISIDATAGDFVEFLRIPIMAKNSFFLHDVPMDVIDDVISVVAHQLEWMNVAAAPMPWNIHIIEKNG